MRWIVTSSFLAAALLWACGEAQPCRNCPPISGAYAVLWPDAGNTSMCPGPRPTTWSISESHGQATLVLDGTTLGGSLYDTYDLFLTGSSYRLRALVIPEGNSVDGGIRLEGTLTTRAPPMVGGDPCESSDAFTARRTAR